MVGSDSVNDGGIGEEAVEQGAAYLGCVDEARHGVWVGTSVRADDGEACSVLVLDSSMAVSRVVMSVWTRFGTDSLVGVWAVV